MNRNNLVLFSLITIALAFVSFSKPQETSIKSTNETEIRIGSLPQVMTALPYWVAVEKGFFAKEGIKVKEITNPKGVDLINFLKNGDLDVVIGTNIIDVANGFNNSKIQPVIFAHSRELKDQPMDGLIVMKESNIKTLKDLEGKKIVIYPGNVAIAVLKYCLKDKGVDISKVEFIPLPPSEHLKMLEQGKADCSYCYDPTKTFCLLSGKTNKIYSGIFDEYGTITNGMSFFSSEYYSKNKEMVKKMMKVWDEAIDYIKKNEPEARKILITRLKLDEKVANAVNLINFLKTSEIDIKSVDATVKAYQKIGVIDNKYVVTDNLFVKK